MSRVILRRVGKTLYDTRLAQAGAFHECFTGSNYHLFQAPGFVTRHYFGLVKVPTLRGAHHILRRPARCHRRSRLYQKSRIGEKSQRGTGATCVARADVTAMDSPKCCGVAENRFPEKP